MNKNKHVAKRRFYIVVLKFGRRAAPPPPHKTQPKTAHGGNALHSPPTKLAEEVFPKWTFAIPRPPSPSLLITVIIIREIPTYRAGPREGSKPGCVIAIIFAVRQFESVTDPNALLAVGQRFVTTH